MNEINFNFLTKYKNKNEHDILFNPRSDDEMKKATQYKVPIYTYSELCEKAEKTNPVKMLNDMFKKSNNNIILLQDPENMNSGHWLAICKNPVKKEIYFFSTYGGKPDIEKLNWISKNDLKKSKQNINIFNDGLHIFQNNGWEIYYNDFPYQIENDQTAVCGIYTAAFIRSKLNPDEFENENKKLIQNNINPAIYYYKKYF